MNQQLNESEEALRKIRSLVLRADKGEDVGAELAELVRKLDHHMSSGGPAPLAWQAGAIRAGEVRQ